ncbi:hypothetical protein Thermus72351_25940 [Thermus brockianus]
MGRGPRALPDPRFRPLPGASPRGESACVLERPRSNFRPLQAIPVPFGDLTFRASGAVPRPLVVPRPPCGGSRTGKPVRAFLGQVALAGFVHRMGYGAPHEAIPLRTCPVSPSCTPPFSPPPPLRYALRLLPSG